MKLVYLLMLSLVLLIASESLGEFSMPKYGNALTRATVEIIEKFYLERTNSLNFYHASIESEEKSMEKNLDAMNEILYQLQSKIIVQIEGYGEFKNANMKRVYNIFIIDSYVSFRRIFSLMDPFYFDYQGFYLIVLTTYSDQQYQTMADMFEYLWAQYIVNINVIWLTPHNDNEAIMYTYYPFTRFFCGKTFPIQLNQFRFGEWLHSETMFFPDKVSNLHGCPLTVSTVRTPPFMILTEKDDGGILTDGIDGILLRVLSQRINFTINLLQCDSQGTVYHNGTSTGALSMVLENKANLTIGYISSTVIRNWYMSSSYVYHTSNLVWMCPPGRLFTSIENLIKPFRNILWSCILIVFFISFLAIRFIKSQPPTVQIFVFGPGNTSPCLNISNIFFGGSLSQLPVKNFARTILAIFMIYCLVIRSSYTGALFNFMRSELREQDVKDIDEMTSRDFKFYIIDSSHEYVKDMPRVFERAVFFPRNELKQVREQLVDPEFKGVLFSSEEFTAFLNAEVFPDQFFHHAEETVSVFNLVIYLHRQSCLTHPINLNILQFLSSGLMECWVSGLIDRSYLLERKANEPKVLVNDQLLGAYQLLAFGLLLGAVAFLVEILSTRVYVLKKFV